MSRPLKFSLEVQERAVRMVLEHRGEHDFQWAVIRSIAGKIGRCTAETLRRWIRQTEVDEGKRLVAYSDRGSQYTNIRYPEQLAEAGIEPSVGSVGESYDNALAETINGLYKAEDRFYQQLSELAMAA